MEHILASVIITTVSEVKKSMLAKKCCERSRRRLSKYMDKVSNTRDIVRRVSELVDFNVHEAIEANDVTQGACKAMAKRASETIDFEAVKEVMDSLETIHEVGKRVTSI